MTEPDKELIERSQEARRRVEGYSVADEVAKLAKLRDAGEISADEYQKLNGGPCWRSSPASVEGSAAGTSPPRSSDRSSRSAHASPTRTAST
jgi:hypothetical protein